ncbi:MAG: restriction endonuclease subunit S [Pseudomonadota bacterium]|nr:restriction endonuclease subunit S [Pseudomonadota bacterium]
MWTGAVTKKSSSGRGSSGKVELTGVKRLRELILNLAVRGKLAHQNPNEEPAILLAEKIATERATLMQAGAIKKSPKLPQIAPEEIPFDIPNGWHWVRLGELVKKIGSGATPRGGKNAYVQSGIPFLRSQNIWNGGLNLQDVAYIPPETHERMANTHVFPNDILLNITGASLGRCTVVPTELEMANVSQHVTIIRTIDPLNQSYLHYLILSPYVQSLVWGRQVGMAREGLSKKVLEQFEIPLPPLEEQHRIVQKVDELMALCDRLEQQTSDQLEAHETLVDTLLGSLLKPAEGSLTQSENATELADNWARLAAHFDTLFTTEQSIDKLRQTILQLATAGKLVPFQVAPIPLKNILCFGPRNGFSPKESTYETGYKVLKLGATTKGWLDLLESKNVDIGNSVPPHLSLEKGDILIQRGNAANHVGCNVLLDADYPNYIYPDLMMKVRVNEEVTIPSFVALCLSAPGSRQFMWERMTGTSGTMPKISKKVVEEIPVALPSLEIQKAVVQKVDELMGLCDQLKERLNQASETRCQLAEAVVNQAVP